MRSPDALSLPLIDAAAKGLARSSRVFTRGNLFHATRRRARLPGRPAEGDFEAFCRGPLAARLRIAPISGLLPSPAPPARAPRLPREGDAYFPAGILVVDRTPIVDLFAASGVLVQARLAVV